MVRVRFAPSPTGYLHIGNARTALFNYLFARKNKGNFILRIEDTDTERSKKEYEIALIEDLKWMGLDWDEGPDRGGAFGPYRQMDRLHIYREVAEKLLKEGKAYRCYCSREEIEERNVKAGKNASAGYDNRCRDITQKEKEGYEREGRSPVLRFIVPESKIVVNDIIRGQVVFESQHIPDFVIMKSDGLPTFHFAVVVDDFTMKITHVIRGEDHLSNTPKHILLFKALGVPIPQFAHMSMTLGPDRTRLSKRHGATSVRAYRQEGYLPDAFFNYISLLGWGTTESQDIFTKEGLIEKFSLERCQKSSAVFDPEKLLWMNGYYIRKASTERLLKLSIPFLKDAGIIENDLSEYEKQYLEKAIALEQEKIKLLRDIPYHIGFFIKDPVYEEDAVKKYLGEEGKKVLSEVVVLLEGCGEWTVSLLEEKIRKFCEEKRYKPSAVFHPLRVAVSGKTKGPGLFEMLEHLGKEKVLSRLRRWI
ncbi:MAG: glutamate--tRNA ligase [Candidatus Omnitrophica bacterium]|nr:glutamate--tRNA ligase [Candidatus Omnitrophota bacterium]